MYEKELLLQRNCGAAAAYQRMLEIDPEFQDKQMRLELFTAQAKMFGSLEDFSTTVKIPVVVHILFNDDEQNISDSQVESQIEVLNNDFRAKNSDVDKVPDVWAPLVGDANMEFYLTDEVQSIQRTETEKNSFGFNDSVKFANMGGADAITPDKILNIWVCNLHNILGYAQFPGGKLETDGVVIDYQAFGTEGTATAPFNHGRTATHELGHFFNLRHIWGDTQDCNGTDFVDDTPNAQLKNFGKPTFPHISCNNGPNGDMFMNYMDYVDDEAMFLFTKGQVERMAATFLGPRIGFVE